MRASVGALLRYSSAHGNSNSDPLQVSPWYLSGPFAAEELSESFFPEAGVDLHGQNSQGESLWAERPEIADGKVCQLPGGPGTTKYLYRTITVPWEMTVTGSFSSNDRMEAWLNGQKLFSIDRLRGCTPDRDRTELHLQRGENQLLIKVNLKIGTAGGFYFELLPDRDAPGSLSYPPVRPATGGALPSETDWEQKQGVWVQRYRKILPEPISSVTVLWPLLRRDFPGETARREMAWEQEDRIFAGKLDPEDPKSLADRYLSAMRDSVLAGRAKALAARVRTTPELDEVRALYYANHEASEAWEHIKYFNFKALRAAISDLKETFGAEYPEAGSFLSRLNALEKDYVVVQAQLQSAGAEVDPRQMTSLSKELTALRRAALVANPLVSGQPVLYVVRQPYWGSHGPTNTEFQNGEDFVEDTGGLKGWRTEGSALKMLWFDKRGGVLKTRTLAEAPTGMVRDPDLHFDAGRVVFSMRKDKADDYHVYEVRTDGTQLRQLTWGSQLSDLDPIYMPSGSIVFSSTRDVKYCHCNIHIQPNLFSMDADGANIVQIGGAPLWEGNPSLMPDGRILYSRWEYVDRQFGCSFGMWTTNPDGTNHALYYGNNSWAPGAIVDPQAIPGTSSAVCIYTGVHDMPWGSMVILDRRLGLDGEQPVRNIWPAYARENLKKLDNVAWTPPDIDRFNIVLPKYEDPWPLYSGRTFKGAGKYFLVSRSVGAVNHHYGSTEKTNASRAKMGIFLVDVFGNELLLHYEAPGCFDPMPVKIRERPVSIPSRVDFTQHDGRFYVQDVYRGQGMEGVARGTVKYLRIVEAPPKRQWAANGWGIDAAQPPAMNWNVTISKAVIGDVPVEEDGSAYFSVPANKYIYFQALDEKKMMIQSMRSGTIVQPGETQGCIGCHESRMSAAPSRMGTAMSRPPSSPQAWYGPYRDFNYLTEVQPVFDKNCVGCHDFGKPAGQRLNLAGDVGPVFNTSYVELHGKSALRWSPRPGQPKLLVNCVYDGPPAVLPPYAWGSHLSRLIDVVTQGHHGVNLSREDLDRLATWIDLNGPYYGSYDTAFGGNPLARSPLTADEHKRLSRLVAEEGGKLSRVGSEISFTRPELSPALVAFKDRSSARYAEALAIVRLGKERLRVQPREDMLGAAAKSVRQADVLREERYTRQFRLENQSRNAVLTGGKVYPYCPLPGSGPK